MLYLLLFLLLLAWVVTRPFYWWRRGVPSLLPLPLLGNFFPYLYLSSREFFDSIYHRFPGSPYVGIYILTRPALFIKDPKMVLEVMEEKGTNFASHGSYLSENRDMLARSLFHLDGAEWKHLRSSLSPFFSPVKIKAMIQFGKSSFDKLVEEVDSRVGKELEAHSTAMFLTADITAASLFGLDSGVFKDRTNSEFYLSAKGLNTPASMLKMMVSLISPAFYDFLKLTAFSPQSNDFIGSMVDASIKGRSEYTGPSRIMMDSLLELKTTNDKAYDKKFLRSQCALMWTGGVETTATTLGFSLNELANNMEIQRELRNKLGSQEGQILLRAVINETLRKYPVFGMLTRMCTQRCRLSTGLQVEPGTLLIIPVLSLQSDPELYTDPEKFLPGRDMPKGAFLSFGAGPRTCLGMRLGYKVLEEALTELLRKYEFSPGTIPMTLAPRTFFTSPKNGVWLKVRAV